MSAFGSPTNTFSVSHMIHVSGQKFSFARGAIILIVGTNNSGKSTFLREIINAIKDYSLKRVMFKEIAFTGASPKELRQRIESHFNVMKDGLSEFVLRRDGGRDFYLNDLSGGPTKLSLDKAAAAFVAFLNSEKRLSLSKDVDTIDLLINKPSHPYHVFMLNQTKLETFSARIKDAFGLEFSVTRMGNPVRGYVGEALGHGDSVSADQNLPKVGQPLQHQGDGLRSYAGIVAEMQAMSHPIMLVDEPEAFLHPPQAKRLGRLVIRELEADRQGFFATHSSEFLQGALSTQSDRVGSHGPAWVSEVLDNHNRFAAELTGLKAEIRVGLT